MEEQFIIGFNFCPICNKGIYWYYLIYLDGYIGFCSCASVIWSAKENPKDDVEIISQKLYMSSNIDLEEQLFYEDSEEIVIINGDEDEDKVIENIHVENILDPDWVLSKNPCCPVCNFMNTVPIAIKSNMVEDYILKPVWVLGWECMNCNSCWEDFEIDWPFKKEYVGKEEFEYIGFNTKDDRDEQEL